MNRASTPPSAAASPLPFPGLSSPSAGFDEPFEMLDACHERMRRTLALLSKLRKHLRASPRTQVSADESSRQAARDVIRYFDLAAPLHHQDEELHIFPALERDRSSDQSLMSLIRQLRGDHVELAWQWVELRQYLLDVADNAIPRLTTIQEAAMDQFVKRYLLHLAAEDNTLYPAARASASVDAQLRPMGEEMAARRRA